MGEDTDLRARARQRDLKEIQQAAAKAGQSQDKVLEAVAALQTLLPGFHPSLFSMKATAWAGLLQQTQPLVDSILAVKKAYPGVDAGAMFQNAPRLLTADPVAVEADALKVRALLQALSDAQVNAVLQAVPSLASPDALARGLATLRDLHPGQDPVTQLAADPGKLLRLGEADAPDSAEYGEDGKRAGTPVGNEGKFPSGVWKDKRQGRAPS